jgi:hypothetical protein
LKIDHFALYLALPTYQRPLSISDHHQYGKEILAEEEQTHKKSDKPDKDSEVNLFILK